MSEAKTAVDNSRPPIEHELKTWQSYFHALADGSKNFELRRDDRDYRPGDTLWLRETEYGSGAYTGRETRRLVTYVLRHEEDLGLIDGFAILSLEPTQLSQALRELEAARSHGSALLRDVEHTEAQLATALRELGEARADRDALAKLVYVPGLWRCAKCDFTLIQANLNTLDGSVTARNEAGDHCPNDAAPLWRVTERQAGNDMVDRCEKAASERDAALRSIAELTRERDGWRTAADIQPEALDQLRRSTAELRGALLNLLPRFEACCRHAKYSDGVIALVTAPARTALASSSIEGKVDGNCPHAVRDQAS